MYILIPNSVCPSIVRAHSSKFRTTFQLGFNWCSVLTLLNVSKLEVRSVLLQFSIAGSLLKLTIRFRCIILTI